MAKVNYHSVHRDRAKQLDDLASILEAESVCKDVSSLRSAADQCRNRDRKNKLWGYDISGLLFDVNDVRHVVPSGVYDVRLSLDVSVKGECQLKDSIDDPLTYLQIDMMIQGRKEKDKILICTWHFDKHVSEKGGSVPDEAHPCYHFQFGGRGMRHLTDLGESLILSPPRLAHPPLDGILAIDFVLSNFCAIQWQQLKKNNQYATLIMEAQRLFWRPYASIISSAWNPPSENVKWQPHHVWPQLVTA